MIKNKNLVYYFLAIGIFILLKIWFANANTNNLIFILKPTNILVDLITGIKSIYIPETGYYYSHINMLIDKSCSGFNFYVLCNAMLYFIVVESLQKNLHKALALPIVMICSYLLSLFVNTSRIFISLSVQNLLIKLLSIEQHIIHESIGVVCNLGFLVLFFLLTKNNITKLKLNEKLT